MKIPSFIYGTAWKEERTTELTKKAVLSGFKAIDTANQKKHYREDLVGQAIVELVSQGIQRESLFLQSKYTYVQGQDHRLPYNPEDTFATQVKSSFANTLQNLHTDYIDSYLLHGPQSHPGLVDADWEVWGAIEELFDSGQAKNIGVSNISVHQLKELVQRARIKPHFVQNRCYASRGWDRSVREYCLDQGISYQGFSLLTANTPILEWPVLQSMAKRFNVTPSQVVFRFAQQIGMVPLTGTTNEKHMAEDLRVSDFELNAEELKIIESLDS